jgi:hypothetical protein
MTLQRWSNTREVVVERSYTYIAAIRMSRLLFWILLRERHMFTNAQAPTESRNVHRSVGGVRNTGMTVEKTESESGDYNGVNPRHKDTNGLHAYVSECSTRIWINSVAE